MSAALRNVAPAAPIDDAVRRGVEHLVARQEPDGAWRGEYGGPMFLLPLYVAACHVTRRPPAPERRDGIVASLRSGLNADGGVGLHREGESCMFTSALSYVALRTLGVPADDADATRLRRWIRAQGTPLGAASWGKFALTLHGLYDYDGLHPILPELWLLPDAAPVHPGRLWCHTRQVYLPMAFLYGMRAHAPTDDLVRALREELYGVPWSTIRFADHRDTLAPSDRLIPGSRLLQLANGAMGVWERLGVTPLRVRALEALAEHIDFEDAATTSIRLGPVNAVLNTLVHHFRQRPDRQAALDRSFAALDRYLWDGADGVVMNGYNSTALWDTVFAAQAILATPHTAELGQALLRAHDYIRDNQVLDDVPDHARRYRHRSRGGWPFSDRAHGWPVTDCTAEGLKCALALERHTARPVPEELLEAAARLILSFQNSDGGFASYERQRGGAWLELLNPSQVFADIMVERSYVECTSSCVQGLVRARARLPGRMDGEIDRAVRRATAFLRRQQRPDGGFEGAWGVCFTYGTWFGVAGLRAAGARPDDPAIAGACRFLERHQRPDGGFGEHARSCTERTWVDRGESHAVNTAWALLALTLGGRARGRAARLAADALVRTQLPDGSWPHQGMVGVFNRTVLIDYDNYRRYFPVWALAAYAASLVP